MLQLLHRSEIASGHAPRSIEESTITISYGLTVWAQTAFKTFSSSWCSWLLGMMTEISNATTTPMDRIYTVANILNAQQKITKRNRLLHCMRRKQIHIVGLQHRVCPSHPDSITKRITVTVSSTTPNDLPRSRIMNYTKMPQKQVHSKTSTSKMSPVMSAV